MTGILAMSAMRAPLMPVPEEALPNFGLRIQPTGRKSFVLFYRTENGTKRLVTVARYPEATLDQARKRARRLMGEVLEGGDPGATQRQAVRSPPTVPRIFC